METKPKPKLLPPVTLEFRRHVFGSSTCYPVFRFPNNRKFKDQYSSPANANRAGRQLIECINKYGIQLKTDTT